MNMTIHECEGCGATFATAKEADKCMQTHIELEALDYERRKRTWRVRRQK